MIYLYVLLIYPSIYKIITINYLSDRRKRLHEILLTLINKESNFRVNRGGLW
jgi:hypothetical protein